MNEETIIKVMEFMRDTCESNEKCETCMFRTKLIANSLACGLSVIPARWHLNTPREWKAFKE